MFTGIIEEKGTIKNIDKKKNLSRISIEAKLSGVLQIGESIAVDGTCLTIVEKKSNVFIAEAIKQTMEITTLKEKQAGAIVNLETSLTLNKLLSGHIVQGHIDTVGVLKVIKKGEQYLVHEYESAKEFMKYAVAKGSIAINGVSLTIAGVQDNSFIVNIIPHTAEVTNLGSLRKGDRVNIEFDIIGKYIYNFIRKMQTDSQDIHKEEKIKDFLLRYKNS